MNLRLAWYMIKLIRLVIYPIATLEAMITGRDPVRENIMRPQPQAPEPPQYPHGLSTLKTVTIAFIVVIPIVLALCLNLFSHKCASQRECVYHDCKDAFNQGQTRSGMYRIKPDHLPAFNVYCDMDTDGGGWVVFQRRMDGTVDFYRNWADYVKGFGDLDGEFWLGLNKIHRLTVERNMLRVDLEDFKGVKQHAIYGSFQVLDSSKKYELNLSGYIKTYGTAGDSLTVHSGMMFTTKREPGDSDTSSRHDNDKNNKYNCADVHKGAWWYRDCHESNLNGKYLSGDIPEGTSANGIHWKTWFKGGGGVRYSLKTTEMKLRPN